MRAASDYLDKLLPPFFKALTQHAERSAYSWHTPGHAGGVGFLKSPVGYALHSFFGENTVAQICKGYEDACKAAGLAGVIVGKAIYEGRLDLAAAIGERAVDVQPRACVARNRGDRGERIAGSGVDLPGLRDRDKDPVEIELLRIALGRAEHEDAARGVVRHGVGDSKWRAAPAPEPDAIPELLTEDEEEPEADDDDGPGDHALRSRLLAACGLKEER